MAVLTLKIALPLNSVVSGKVNGVHGALEDLGAARSVRNMATLRSGSLLTLNHDLMVPKLVKTWQTSSQLAHATLHPEINSEAPS